MLDLFEGAPPWQEALAEDAVILRRYARHDDHWLFDQIMAIASQRPFQHRITPGGFRMSVAMTHCGLYGRPADAHPINGGLLMPDNLRKYAITTALSAGFTGFRPDSCLMNRYAVDSKLSLHQDKDEKDLRQPIVSVSLGLAAVFQFGGFERGDPVTKVMLEHGDVVVWGGRSRLRFHGILPLKPGSHPLTGKYRYNMTFRCAG
ncbi:MULTISPECIES: alpha-ketoglutarate-dependent dioxygenase AlkB [unclassified Tatumella]|uniref:alpha-ketoglutarate-dependent dioxygenase AlkB n=1 Tax=unclassified Tatumella TaxID=2649542 RepID=UPI001BB077D0|nr:MULTISPECIES: alpha-ketoglutarate-dependent dioxygenase AlkB [unclassified Tatumella]MBS0854849.1 alpha-ketoglutarate-dependent dioxygenase AlkB [Tatumella sp. JGM16]MBS0912189.1 alpha-ketoglutarate-dependent dioxygenase AlkB [Tatumella sp. JGM91]